MPRLALRGVWKQLGFLIQQDPKLPIYQSNYIIDSRQWGLPWQSNIPHSSWLFPEFTSLLNFAESARKQLTVPQILKFSNLFFFFCNAQPWSAGSMPSQAVLRTCHQISHCHVLTVIIVPTCNLSPCHLFVKSVLQLRFCHVHFPLPDSGFCCKCQKSQNNSHFSKCISFLLLL